MTTEAPSLATNVTPPSEPDPGTIRRLILRWLFLVAMTVLAFWKSLASLVESTVEGSLDGFVWMVPLAAIVAALGVTRRERTELPIHDRQTDIIVGGLGLGLAVMLQAILVQRYSLYFHLLRIDLAAMWFFITAGTVMLFGLRPVIRFGWTFMVLICMMPLFYQLAVIFFGGNRSSAGVATVGIAGFATAVAVGRSRGRALLGAIVAVLVGATILVAITVFVPDAPLLVYQMVPSVSAMVIAGMSLYLYSRRGGVRKRVLERAVEPLASRQVYVGISVVLVTAIAISLVNLPPQNQPHTHVQGIAFGRPLAAPAGWHLVEQHDFPWVRRIYGRDADLIRQRFLADVGKPEWDKLARPRTVIVDTTTTYRPFSLEVYPARVMYAQSSARISDPVAVDLGHGIGGSMVTIVDDKRLLTYNVLSWVWRDDESAQRVMIATVDNHEADVVFPEPNGGLVPTLSTMFSVFFRGNQAIWDSDPAFKDLDLLTSFGQGLVTAQFDRAAGLRS